MSIVGAFDRRTAKIYRHTFARNPVPTPRKGEFIPEIFQNPFMQDVTDMYCYTSDIEIECYTRNKSSHAYLCVFNNLEWKPIVAGNVVRDKAEFKKIAKNIVYLPVYYEKPNKYSPFDYPFILSTKGTIEYLIPDSIHTHTHYIWNERILI